MQSNSSNVAGAPNMAKVTFRDCKICGFVGKSGHSLSLHLSMKHSVSLLDYAEKYEGYQRPRCTVCGAPARYKGDHYEGRKRKKGLLFYATCSDECRANAIGNKHRGMSHANASAALKANWAHKSPEQRQHIIEKRIKGVASAMRNGGSSIEKTVAEELMTLGVRFERQKQVGQYIVDFCLIDFDIYLEVDGCYWHGCQKCGYDKNPEIQEKAPRQRRREGYFRMRGLTVIRIPEHDIRDNLSAVRELLQQWATPRQGASLEAD